jgi:hypothetical protein
MISRKSLLVVVVTLLFAVGLSACTGGTPMMADHDVDISIDEAMAGQDALMSGAMAGDISLTESQASSFITELMMQNGVNKLDIAGISAGMDGDMNTVTINLGTPIAGIDSLGFSGHMMSAGGIVSVDLDSAWAGGMGVDGSLLDMVSSQLNASLAGMPLGLPDGPVGVTSEQAEMISGMIMQMGLNSAEISAVKAHFDDGHIGLKGEFANAVAGVDSIGVLGAVSVDGGALNIDLSEAFAGNMLADSGLTSMIAGQINSSLSGLAVLPVNIDANGGELSISVNQ